ncbi:MAG: ABC transporter substrate-binding protein, partial [Pusillimonas sp.]
MKFYSSLLGLALGAAVSTSAVAQDVLKIGELNSYKTQPAFLGPYKNGMELAVEQINAAGGLLGKKV